MQRAGPLRLVWPCHGRGSMADLLARMRARRRRTRMRVRQQSTTQGRSGRKQDSHSQAINQMIKACNEHGKASTARRGGCHVHVNPRGRTTPEQHLLTEG